MSHVTADLSASKAALSAERAQEPIICMRLTYIRSNKSKSGTGLMRDPQLPEPAEQGHANCNFEPGTKCKNIALYKQWGQERSLLMKVIMSFCLCSMTPLVKLFSLGVAEALLLLLMLLLIPASQCIIVASILLTAQAKDSLREQSTKSAQFGFFAQHALCSTSAA
jgi:hypothetical protein